MTESYIKTHILYLLKFKMSMFSPLSVEIKAPLLGFEYKMEGEGRQLQVEVKVNLFQLLPSPLSYC